MLSCLVSSRLSVAVSSKDEMGLFPREVNVRYGSSEWRFSAPLYAFTAAEANRGVDVPGADSNATTFCQFRLSEGAHNATDPSYISPPSKEMRSPFCGPVLVPGFASSATPVKILHKSKLNVQEKMTPKLNL